MPLMLAPSDYVAGSAMKDAASLGARLIFFVLPLSEPDAGAAAILVDELHSSTLKRAYDGGQSCGITDVAAGFNVAHRVSVDLSGFCEVPYAPI
jgi:hypothetical protein